MAATTAVVNGKVVMAEETVKKIMLLNKLWIPDVLIDIIKDYLYVNKETVLRNYYKAMINYSIWRLNVRFSNTLDQYGRIRKIHWAIGHDCVQLQDVMCAVCGEYQSRHHTNLPHGVCAMEWDGPDGTLLEFTEEERDVYYSDEEEEKEEEDWDW